MTSTHTVTIDVTTEMTKTLIRFARIVEHHMGALATDLEQMIEPELIAERKPLPDDARGDTIKVRTGQ